MTLIIICKSTLKIDYS